MAKNGTKSDAAWTKKSGNTAPKSSTVLPGKPGETVGRSTPPWPISAFPPFRHNDSKRAINESPGKPYRD